MPIRCSSDSPRLTPVNLLAIGVRTLLYAGAKMTMQRQLKVVREAGGIEKLCMWLSMTCPCSMNSGNRASAVLKIMAARNTGSILAKILSSSTCVTVQSFHGLGVSRNFSSAVVMVAARSKNLNPTNHSSYFSHTNV
jgi:hypothetical protein